MEQAYIYNKKMLPAILLLFLILFQVNFLYSQTSITGVVNSTGNEPLIGVTILEKDTNNGTTTDIDGRFSLTVNKPDATLVFSYIGHENTTRVLDGQTEMTIILEEASSQLEEVVVTALGIKRQKRSLGYSTESFDGMEILQSNAANVVSALSGRAAGVNIVTPNGVEGGTSRITIRGNNNITSNNQPLIVVDGVPLENPPGMTNIGRGRDWGSPINNINPEDIADINILKGPTASALYGSRGANGVMLISTKRGKQQQGIGVTYAITHKIIQPARYRDVQNVYGGGGPVSLLEPQLERNADGEYQFPGNFDAVNGPFGKSTEELFGFYSSGVSWGPKMNGETVRWWDGPLRPYTPQPDNLKLYFQNGHTTRHNISFSGGNDKGGIRVSLSATDHDAAVPESEFQQYTAHIGSNINISSKINTDIAFNYVRYERLNTPSLGDDNKDSFAKGILYSWPRSYKGIEKEINILPNGTRNDYGGAYPYRFSPRHLWWNTYNNTTTNSRDLLIGALTINYDITSWLKATGRIGMNFNIEQFEIREAPIDLLGVEQGFYSNELTRDRVSNNDFYITAHKDNILKNNFNLSLSLGGTQWQRKFYGIRGQSTDWINPHLYTFNNAEDTTQVPVPLELHFAKKINSVYGLFDISFKNYLFLQLSGRNDWSSALPLDNNDYFYPSASLSFIASEAFNISNNWLSFLKLRGAFAQTGSDTDPFQLDFVYNSESFGGVQTASLPGIIPPITLKPQRAQSYELGLSLGLFRDKINLDFTYYYIKSFDQILNSPAPASSGASAITINSAVLENQGIEAKLDFNLWHGKNSYAKTSFNFSRNRNRVANLGNGAKIIELANIWGFNGPAISVQEGQNYGTIVGYDYVYHEDSGKPILNEDGTHYLITENRVPIGNAAPDFTGGWSTEFGFKGFTLKTLVDTKWGGDIYAGSYVIGLQTGQSPETLVEREGGGLPYTDPAGNTRNIGVILDGVYADGRPNDKVVHYYFKYLPNAGGWGRFLSTPGILENTWVKMREVSLSYNFTNRLLAKTNIFQNLEVALVGRDLFYIYTTLPDRINPEGANGSGNAQGLEWASFPGMRSFSVRLAVGF